MHACSDEFPGHHRVSLTNMAAPHRWTSPRGKTSAAVEDVASFDPHNEQGYAVSLLLRLPQDSRALYAPAEAAAEICRRRNSDEDPVALQWNVLRAQQPQPQFMAATDAMAALENALRGLMKRLKNMNPFEDYGLHVYQYRFTFCFARTNKRCYIGPALDDDGGGNKGGRLMDGRGGSGGGGGGGGSKNDSSTTSSPRHQSMPPPLISPPSNEAVARVALTVHSARDQQLLDAVMFELQAEHAQFRSRTQENGLGQLFIGLLRNFLGDDEAGYVSGMSRRRASFGKAWDGGARPVVGDVVDDQSVQKARLYRQLRPRSGSWSGAASRT